MSVLFSNNASTTLSAGVGNSATSITVADGSVFPSISASDYFYVTLEVDSDSDLKEIVKVTARSGNTLTITRGQDGTSARTFSSGDKCELRLNAAALNDAVLGGNTTEMSLNQFTGDGSTTAFTLSSSPDENLTNVFLSGVYQSKSNYSISGNTLTFTTAPPNGLAIEVMVAEVVEFAVNVVADDSVTTAKIADDAVTSDKLSNALSTKIAGIESGATADQTATEIKTAYESNSDTNAFTDADHTKLDGIEASADITDTVNVTAAGALMDSELTSEASVKALNQGVATTDSPTFAGLTVDTDTLYVDSTNNRVGIGATSVDTKLHLEESGATPLFVKTENSAGALLVGNNSAGNSFVSAQTSGKPLILETENTERARLTSDGKLLVGQTDADNTVNGVRLSGSGTSWLTATSDYPMGLNRKTSDGNILWFGKDGSNVGSIGTASGDLTIYSTASGHKGLRFGEGYIFPTDNSGNSTDATADLGLSAYRFKDLYLSGAANVGGGASISPDADADNLVIQENGAAGITIGSSASSVGSIRFADSGSPRAGMIYYNHVGNEMRFYTNASERARLTSDGDLGIGTTAIMQDFGDGRTTLALKGTGTADYSTLQLGNYGTTSNGQIHGLVNFYDGTTSVSRIQSVRASNTSDADLVFYTAPSSGGITERMRINASGCVTKPSNPAFRAYTSTEWTTMNAYVNSGWTENYDRGNNFNQGTFTAPVAGVYHFDLFWDAYNSTTQIDIRVNGTSKKRYEPPNGGSAWETEGYSGDLYLSANDAVTLYVYGGSGTYPMHMGSSGHWGWFSGHLIG